MKTKEEIIHDAIVKWNRTASDINKFALSKVELKMFTDCMEAYASQFKPREVRCNPDLRINDCTCGKVLIGSDNYCPQCGSKIIWE